MSSGNTEVYKRASDARELEFEVAVSHLTGVLGTEPVLYKNRKCSSPLSPLPNPTVIILEDATSLSLILKWSQGNQICTHWKVMAPASKVHLVGDCSFSFRKSCLAWLWYCWRSRPDWKKITSLKNLTHTNKAVSEAAWYHKILCK